MSSLDPHQPICPVCRETDQVWPISAIVLADTEIAPDELPAGRSPSFTINLLTDRDFRGSLIGRRASPDKVSDLARRLEIPPIYIHPRGSVLKSLFSAAERRRQIEREKEHFHRPCERWFASYFCRRDEVAFLPAEGRPVAPADFQAYLKDGTVPAFEFEACAEEIVDSIRQPLLEGGWEYLGVFPMRYDTPDERRFARHVFRRPAEW